MPTEMPAPPRARRFVANHYVIRVGSEWSPVRATAIWPIADVLDAAGCLQAPAPAAADPELVVDLRDSRMIVPPSMRRRRSRPVSSRAVFYRAARA